MTARIAVCLALALLGCSEAASEAPPSNRIGPETLAIVPCRFIVPKSVEGTPFRCADLGVPENRATEGSRSITLHVIVFNGKEGGVPTVILNGGPGGPSEQEVMSLSIGDPISIARYQPFLDQGDLVFFDQRGVGRSIPRLSCVPEADSIDDPDPARTCIDRLKASGVDFAGYDSQNNADDVHDLRVALGVKQVNLHGISYGSRLALEVMRRHPADVRASVIDGILPAQAKVFTETVPNLDATITRIFTTCASDARCNEAYPDLEQAFTQLKAKLDATPFGPPTRPFDWRAFEDTVFTTLYAPGAAGQLPFYVHKLLRQTPGEWTTDQNAQASRANDEDKKRFDELTALPLGKEVFARLQRAEGELFREIVNDVSFGMYSAVSCADSGQYESLPQALRALDAVRPELRDFGEDEARSAFAACRLLPAVAPASDVIEPVASEIPTLVIGGDYDPITPSKNATLVASTLTASQLVVVPAGAHGLVDACGVDIKTTFLRTRKAVDASCATAETISFFYAGNGGSTSFRSRPPFFPNTRRPLWSRR